MCRVFWPLYLKFLGLFFNFPDFKYLGLFSILVEFFWAAVAT